MSIPPPPLVEDLSSEEPLEDDDTEQTLPIPNIVEPVVSPNEAIISRHALLGI